MQIYLAITPQEVKDASRYTHTFAHVAYRIGPESTLLQQDLLLNTNYGLMSISDQDAPQIDDAEKLAQAVTRECQRRNYSGVVLDFEAASTPDKRAFVKNLAEKLERKRYTLYVPEPYAISGAIVLINTAVSGGNFFTHLKETQTQYGGVVALDAQRLAMDFTLPARTGVGQPLKMQQLTQLLEQESPSVFFSPDLCARYFTYTSQSQTHFILYDDAETLLRKLRVGNSLGFRGAFLMYPEVKDLLPRLFSHKQNNHPKNGR